MCVFGVRRLPAALGGWALHIKSGDATRCSVRVSSPEVSLPERRLALRDPRRRYSGARRRVSASPAPLRLSNVPLASEWSRAAIALHPPAALTRGVSPCATIVQSSAGYPSTRTRSASREAGPSGSSTMLDMTDSNMFVSFDVGASGAEVEHVRRLFADVGLHVTVTDQPYSLVASGDVILPDAFVVIATTASAGFVTAFAAKAGTDAYERLKLLVDGLRTARRRDEGRIEIILRSEVAGTPDIVISPDTPAEAFRTLLTSDLPSAPSGTIEYDLARGQWRDVGPA